MTKMQFCLETGVGRRLLRLLAWFAVELRPNIAMSPMKLFLDRPVFEAILFL